MNGQHHPYFLRGPPRGQPPSSRIEQSRELHSVSLTPNSGTLTHSGAISGSVRNVSTSPHTVSDGGGLTDHRYINGSGEMRRLADAPTTHSFRSQFHHTPPNFQVPGSDHIVVLGTIPHTILQYSVTFYTDIMLVAVIETFLSTAFDAMPNCPPIRILLQLRKDIGEQAGYSHPFYHRISNEFVDTLCDQHADFVERRIMNETYRDPPTSPSPSSTGTGAATGTPQNAPIGAAEAIQLRRQEARRAANEIRSFGARMSIKSSSTIKALLKEQRGLPAVLDKVIVLGYEFPVLMYFGEFLANCRPSKTDIALSSNLPRLEDLINVESPVRTAERYWWYFRLVGALDGRTAEDHCQSILRLYKRCFAGGEAEAIISKYDKGYVSPAEFTQIIAPYYAFVDDYSCDVTLMSDGIRALALMMKPYSRTSSGNSSIFIYSSGIDALEMLTLVAVGILLQRAFDYAGGQGGDALQRFVFGKPVAAKAAIHLSTAPGSSVGPGIAKSSIGVEHLGLTCVFHPNASHLLSDCSIIKNPTRLDSALASYPFKLSPKLNDLLLGKPAGRASANVVQLRTPGLTGPTTYPSVQQRAQRTDAYRGNRPAQGALGAPNSMVTYSGNSRRPANIGAQNPHANANPKSDRDAMSAGTMTGDWRCLQCAQINPDKSVWNLVTNRVCFRYTSPDSCTMHGRRGTVEEARNAGPGFVIGGQRSLAAGQGMNHSVSFHNSVEDHNLRPRGGFKYSSTVSGASPTGPAPVGAIAALANAADPETSVFVPASQTAMYYGPSNNSFPIPTSAALGTTLHRTASSLNAVKLIDQPYTILKRKSDKDVTVLEFDASTKVTRAWADYRNEEELPPVPNLYCGKPQRLPDEGTSLSGSAISLPNEDTPLTGFATSLPDHDMSLSGSAISLPNADTSLSISAISTPDEDAPMAEPATSLPDEDTPPSGSATSLSRGNTSRTVSITSLPDGTTSLSVSVSSLPDEDTPMTELATSLPDEDMPLSGSASSLPDEDMPLSGSASSLSDEDTPLSVSVVCKPALNANNLPGFKTGLRSINLLEGRIGFSTPVDSSTSADFSTSTARVIGFSTPQSDRWLALNNGAHRALQGDLTVAAAEASAYGLARRQLDGAYDTRSGNQFTSRITRRPCAVALQQMTMAGLIQQDGMVRNITAQFVDTVPSVYFDNASSPWTSELGNLFASKDAWHQWNRAEAFPNTVRFSNGGHLRFHSLISAPFAFTRSGHPEGMALPRYGPWANNATATIMKRPDDGIMPCWTIQDDSFVKSEWSTFEDVTVEGFLLPYARLLPTPYLPAYRLPTLPGAVITLEYITTSETSASVLVKMLQNGYVALPLPESAHARLRLTINGLAQGVEVYGDALTFNFHAVDFRELIGPNWRTVILRSERDRPLPWFPQDAQGNAVPQTFAQSVLQDYYERKDLYFVELCVASAPIGEILERFPGYYNIEGINHVIYHGFDSYAQWSFSALSVFMEAMVRNRPFEEVSVQTAWRAYTSNAFMAVSTVWPYEITILIPRRTAISVKHFLELNRHKKTIVDYLSARDVPSKQRVEGQPRISFFNNANDQNRYFMSVYHVVKTPATALMLHPRLPIRTVVSLGGEKDLVAVLNSHSPAENSPTENLNSNILSIATTTVSLEASVPAAVAPSEITSQPTGTVQLRGTAPRAGFPKRDVLVKKTSDLKSTLRAILGGSIEMARVVTRSGSNSFGPVTKSAVRSASKQIGQGLVKWETKCEYELDQEGSDRTLGCAVTLTRETLFLFRKDKPVLLTLCHLKYNCAQVYEAFRARLKGRGGQSCAYPRAIHPVTVLNSHSLAENSPTENLNSNILSIATTTVAVSECIPAVEALLQSASIGASQSLQLGNVIAAPEASIHISSGTRIHNAVLNVPPVAVDASTEVRQVRCRFSCEERARMGAELTAMLGAQQIKIVRDINSSIDCESGHRAVFALDEQVAPSPGDLTELRATAVHEASESYVHNMGQLGYQGRGTVTWRSADGLTPLVILHNYQRHAMTANRAFDPSRVYDPSTTADVRLTDAKPMHGGNLCVSDLARPCALCPGADHPLVFCDAIITPQKLGFALTKTGLTLSYELAAVLHGAHAISGNLGRAGVRLADVVLVTPESSPSNIVSVGVPERILSMADLGQPCPFPGHAERQNHTMLGCHALRTPVNLFIMLTRHKYDMDKGLTIHYYATLGVREMMAAVSFAPAWYKPLVRRTLDVTDLGQLCGFHPNGRHTLSTCWDVSTTSRLAAVQKWAHVSMTDALAAHFDTKLKASWRAESLAEYVSRSKSNDRRDTPPGQGCANAACGNRHEPEPRKDMCYTVAPSYRVPLSQQQLHTSSPERVSDARVTTKDLTSARPRRTHAAMAANVYFNDPSRALNTSTSVDFESGPSQHDQYGTTAQNSTSTAATLLGHTSARGIVNDLFDSRNVNNALSTGGSRAQATLQAGAHSLMLREAAARQAASNTYRSNSSLYTDFSGAGSTTSPDSTLDLSRETSPLLRRTKELNATPAQKDAVWTTENVERLLLAVGAPTLRALASQANDSPVSSLAETFSFLQTDAVVPIVEDYGGRVCVAGADEQAPPELALPQSWANAAQPGLSREAGSLVHQRLPLGLPVKSDFVAEEYPLAEGHKRGPDDVTQAVSHLTGQAKAINSSVQKLVASIFSLKRTLSVEDRSRFAAERDELAADVLHLVGQLDPAREHSHYHLVNEIIPVSSAFMAQVRLTGSNWPPTIVGPGPHDRLLELLLDPRTDIQAAIYFNRSAEDGVVLKCGDRILLLTYGQDGMSLIEDSGASQLTITRFHSEYLNCHVVPYTVALQGAGGAEPPQMGMAFGNSQGDHLEVIRKMNTPYETITRVEAIVLQGYNKTALLGGLEPALHCAGINHRTCHVDYRPFRCSHGDFDTIASLPLAMLGPPSAPMHYNAGTKSGQYFT